MFLQTKRAVSSRSGSLCFEPVCFLPLSRKLPQDAGSLATVLVESYSGGKGNIILCEYSWQPGAVFTYSPDTIK
jgi:hypothetical protein